MPTIEETVASIVGTATPSGYLCDWCDEDYLWPCPEGQAADRAEARLREVGGDE